MIAQLLMIAPNRKQTLLEGTNAVKRMETLLTLLEQELDIQQTEKRIRGRVKQSMEKSQRDYYLHEQVKAIQKELGQNEQEFTEYEEKDRFSQDERRGY